MVAAVTDRPQPPREGALDVCIASLLGVLRQRGWHPGRTVVLLPYAQLMPVARRAWRRQAGDGFSPRFETTMNWARRLGGFVAGQDDLAFDHGRDLITAQSLLERAGLGPQRALLASTLVDTAAQLAGPAAAQSAAERGTWATTVRPLVGSGWDSPVLAVEAALARIGLEWAAASAYATDVLFEPLAREQTDALVVFEGLQADALTNALRQRWGDRAVVFKLLGDVGGAPPGGVALHPSVHAEDEAEKAAACVLHHLAAGRGPVGLAAIDRTVTRRIRAMLGARGVAVRDETGWKLSTTRAAAELMLTLRAIAWDASTDEVLDWLKHTPAIDLTQVSSLESTCRRLGLARWPSEPPVSMSTTPLAALWTQINRWRQALQPGRLWLDWPDALRQMLTATGQWGALAADPAGQAVIAALRLAHGAAADWAGLPQARRRMGLSEWTAWVTEVLEAASFKPEHPASAQVVVVPLAQVLAQPWAALVLPGCDEVNLPASPEPPGTWGRAQRAALGLPSREDLAATQHAAWQHALTLPHVDVLWRTVDSSGEPVLPSPLVQQWLLAQGERAEAGAETLPSRADPRVARPVKPRPVAAPQPVGQRLPVTRLSASAYDDLRRCPYRFFALRQLGLQEPEELATEVGKRDFGTWLHAVLGAFHTLQADDPLPDGPARTDRMNALADAQTAAMGLAEGEFLPFAASWPGVRDAYLAWLVDHEAEGATFVHAELAASMPLGAVTLAGRLDRVDRQRGTPLVMDYKTEDLQKTKQRVKVPTEDTQLAFYAALLEDDTLSAAYLHLGDRAATLVSQPYVGEARDALVEGIRADMAAIASGATLRALGEGSACNHCAARGLCRKDFWA